MSRLDAEAFEELFEQERSLFNSCPRRSGALFDTAEDAARSDSILTDDYLQDAAELRQEIAKKKRLLDAAVLAVCKCKKSQVLSNISLKMAKSLNKDFTLNGFAGKEVQDFLRLVKERFFLQRDADIYGSSDKTTHIADDVECIFMSFGNSIPRDDVYDVHASHISLEFVSKNAGKHFWLQIPLRENTHFDRSNYEDVLLGKYVLTANIVEKERRQSLGGLKSGDGEELEITAVVRRKNVAAEFSAARLSKLLFKYLTSDGLDGNDIRNWHSYDLDCLDSYSSFCEHHDICKDISEDL